MSTVSDPMDKTLSIYFNRKMPFGGALLINPPMENLDMILLGRQIGNGIWFRNGKSALKWWKKLKTWKPQEEKYCVTYFEILDWSYDSHVEYWLQSLLAMLHTLEGQKGEIL